MALLAMASYCTPDNNRFPLTLRTLDSLARTVDWSRHRLVVIDNGSTCPQARELFDWPTDWSRGGIPPVQVLVAATGVTYTIPPLTLIRNPENRGQARALNQGWHLREPGEVVARCDDDLDFRDIGWLDRLCDCLDREPTLGLVGLKRPDAWERPDHPDAAWRSELRMLPHEPGQDWLVVEQVKSLMGTAVAVSPKLVDAIGYLYQGSFKWGCEDPDYLARAAVAGFWAACYPSARVTHLDTATEGSTPYQRWKEEQAKRHHPELDARRNAYFAGTLSIYHGPDDE